MENSVSTGHSCEKTWRDCPEGEGELQPVCCQQWAREQYTEDVRLFNIIQMEKWKKERDKEDKNGTTS